MNNVKKIVVVKKWYLDGSSTKVIDVDAKVFDREEYRGRIFIKGEADK